MSDTAAQVHDYLQGWAEAYGAKDADALVAMALDGDVQLVGTGADEVRFGLDEYRAQAERDMSQADELESRFSNVHITEVGDVAFVYADVTVAGSAGGQSFEMGGLRATLALVRTPEGLRMAQSHLSAPQMGQAEGESF